jgi:riboflavin kinase/FMN adenylyltransferase
VFTFAPVQVFRDLHTIKHFKNSVVTIGTFDGVHKGHREIINTITSLAKAVNGESVIITFYPHPRNIINPQEPVYYITTLEEKLFQLSQLGVDNIVVVPFSREFSEMEAEVFADAFLIKKFSPKIIVFGYDHKFGRNRKGDIQLLKQIAAKDQVQVEEISEQTLNNITISSTMIRNYLKAGNIAEANALLGYHFSLRGIVVKGDQIGRTIGYPTANLHIDDVHKIIPGHGVYVVKVMLKNNGTNHFGLLNIGNRPTLHKTEKRIETYILDFDKTIYGEEITLTFLHFLRGDKKFDTLHDLAEAIRRDEIAGREYLSSGKY